MERNPVLKLAVFALIVLLVVWFVGGTLPGTGLRIGSGYNGGAYIVGDHGRMGMMTGGYGMGGYGMGGYAYGGGSVNSLLSLLINLLFVLFIVSLVVGVIVYLKNSIFTQQEVESLKESFAGKRIAKKTCASCGKELNAEWKACPYCGKQVE